MRIGTLELLLVKAEGLNNSDFLANMDPYVIIQCRSQQQKSKVASGQGGDPEWNEHFVFTVTEGVADLTLKIMDSDNLNDDDYVGEARIPLDVVFQEGSLPPTSYNVVLPDQTYCGEIKVGLTFTEKKQEEDDYCKEAEKETGGWKKSFY